MFFVMKTCGLLASCCSASSKFQRISKRSGEAASQILPGHCFDIDQDDFVFGLWMLTTALTKYVVSYLAVFALLAGHQGRHVCVSPRISYVL